jgi:hypothetical protein
VKYPILLFALALSCAAQHAYSQAAILFQQDDNDWIIGGNATWFFSEDVLVGRLDSGAGFVVTDKKYQNFELTLEFLPDSSVNSGVFVRCANQSLSYEDCYEVNIWDMHPNQDFRTGAIVAKAKPTNYVETIGKWNTYRIVCKNESVQTWVNGVETSSLQDSALSKGFIALQAAGAGEIRFKNVVIAPIE